MSSSKLHAGQPCICRVFGSLVCAKRCLACELPPPGPFLLTIHSARFGRLLTRLECPIEDEDDHTVHRTLSGAQERARQKLLCRIQNWFNEANGSVSMELASEQWSYDPPSVWPFDLVFELDHWHRLALRTDLCVDESMYGRISFDDLLELVRKLQIPITCTIRPVEIDF